ncbi:MAG: topoisomerase C-terminal repeat-containing protein [Clostridia bacterium]|nr:topoisomerase C-terminal repeat-containing protein [Clostridia bacterium]
MVFEIVLIIAEKPSLARNIMAGIGKMTKHDGYFEGEGYIVTWAFGHLFSLADVEEYSDSKEENPRWTMKNLPCFPEKFKFEIKKDNSKKTDSGAKKQFEIIKILCNRPDIDTIINAGDADREGEIIVRTCIQKALGETEKELKRIWLPDQTPQTVQEALQNLKSESEYDNLANEGYARTFTDWLYGVNLTRYASLRAGTLLRVGRVIVPIVKAIYDRDMSIRNFVPEIYYAAVSKAVTNGEEIELTSKNKFSKSELQKVKELCDSYNSVEATVTAKKKKKDKLNPPKLYSLTKLQNYLGKRYKMSMAESLEILQGLYEKGYVTYPRTNSEYLAVAEQGKMKTILASVKELGYPVEFRFDKKIFDDSKIESHSALTPTYKIPDKNKLSENELKVYSSIMRRFVAVFCSEECTVEKTEITVSVGDFEEFSLKGTVIQSPGWTAYDSYNKKDKILPPLEKGDKVNINFVPVEKETSPPKHYTIETLNNYLKNPFKDEKQQLGEKEAEEEEYRAMFEGLELGTEATRTGIIDNARKSEYILLKKDTYTILPAGEHLVESLERMNIIMDKFKTSQMGVSLKKVFRGENTVSDSVEMVKNEITEIFNAEKQGGDNFDGFVGDIVGRCPLCGKDVKRTRFGYGCSGYRDGCKFSVNNVICSKVISVENIRKILEGGSSELISGFISKKNGKEFSAKLVLEDGKVVFKF